MPFASRFSGMPAKALATTFSSVQSTARSRGMRKSSNAAASDLGDTPLQVSFSVPSAMPVNPSASILSSANSPESSRALAHTTSRAYGRR